LSPGAIRRFGWEEVDMTDSMVTSRIAATVVEQGSLMRRPANVRGMLRDSGLRPTRQRMALADILFANGNRHVSAEQLHEEALRARVPVSLATVYNTLHQFTEAGLLREVAVDGSKTYFDTNTSDHHHFFLEDENRVVDIPGDGVSIDNLPMAPEGMEIVRVDVVVRIRPKQSA
jgi:Fur family iron response transcriptional regulator